MSKWQPIETAPRDGSSILTWSRKHIIAHWSTSQFNKWGNGWDFSGNGFISPTQWMPLPDEPK